MAILDTLTLQFDADFGAFRAKADQAARESQRIKQNIESKLNFKGNLGGLVEQLKLVQDNKQTVKIQNRESTTAKGTVSRTQTATITSQQKDTAILKGILNSLDALVIAQQANVANPIVSAINMGNDALAKRIGTTNKFAAESAKETAKATSFGFRLQTALSDTLISKKIAPAVSKALGAGQRVFGDQIKELVNNSRTAIRSNLNTTARVGGVLLQDTLDGGQATRFNQALQSSFAEGATQAGFIIRESLADIFGLTTDGRSARNQLSSINNTVAGRVTAAGASRRDLTLLENERGLAQEELAQIEIEKIQFEQGGAINDITAQIENNKDALKDFQKELEILKVERRAAQNTSNRSRLATKVNEQQDLVDSTVEEIEKLEGQRKRLERQQRKFNKRIANQEKVINRFNRQIAQLSDLLEKQEAVVGNLSEAELLKARKGIIEKLQAQGLTGAESKATSRGDIAEAFATTIDQIGSVAEVIAQLEQDLADQGREGELVRKAQGLQDKIEELQAARDKNQNARDKAEIKFEGTLRASESDKEEAEFEAFQRQQRQQQQATATNEAGQPTRQLTPEEIEQRMAQIEEDIRNGVDPNARQEEQEVEVTIETPTDEDADLMSRLSALENSIADGDAGVSSSVGFEELESSTERAQADLSAFDAREEKLAQQIAILQSQLASLGVDPENRATGTLKTAANVYKGTKDRLAAAKQTFAELNKELDELKKLEINQELREDLEQINDAIDAIRKNAAPQLIAEIYEKLKIRVEDNDKLPAITPLSTAELERFATINGLDQIDPAVYYDSINNQILIAQDQVDNLGKSLQEGSGALVDSLLSAITQAQQTDFGKINQADIQAGRKSAKELIDKSKLSVEELKLVNRLVAEARDAGKSTAQISAELEAAVASFRINQNIIDDRNFNNFKQEADTLANQVKSYADELQFTILENFSETNRFLPDLREAVETAKIAVTAIDEFNSTRDVINFVNPEQSVRDIKNLYDQLKQTKLQIIEALENAQQEEVSLASIDQNNIVGASAAQASTSLNNLVESIDRLASAATRASAAQSLEEFVDDELAALRASMESGDSGSLDIAPEAFDPLTEDLESIRALLGDDSAQPSTPVSDSGIDDELEALRALMVEGSSMTTSQDPGVDVDDELAALRVAMETEATAQADVGVEDLDDIRALLDAENNTSSENLSDAGVDDELEALRQAIASTPAEIADVEDDLESIRALLDNPESNPNNNQGQDDTDINNELTAFNESNTDESNNIVEDDEIVIIDDDLAALRTALTESTSDSDNNVDTDSSPSVTDDEAIDAELEALRTAVNSTVEEAGSDVEEDLDDIRALLNNPPDEASERNQDVDDEAIDAELEALRALMSTGGNAEAGNFVDGFIGAINESIDAVAETTENLGEESVQGFKDGTDSASPSKKMRQEGRNYLEGFSMEILSGLAGLKEQTKNLGSAAVDGFANAVTTSKGAVKNAVQTVQEAARFDVIPQTVDFNINPAEVQEGLDEIAVELADPIDVVAEANIELQAAQNAGTLQEITDHVESRIAEADVAIANADAEIVRDIRVELGATTTAENLEIAAVDTIRAVNEISEAVDETIEDVQDRVERVRSGEQSAGQAAGEATRDVVDAVSNNLSGVGDSVNELRNGLSETVQGITNFAGDFMRGFGATPTLLGRINLAGLAAGAGLLFFKDSIIDTIQSTAQFQIELQSTQARLAAINQNNINIFDRFSKSASQAGVSVFDFANNFAEIAASLDGSLPDVEAFFGDLTAGLASRGVGGEAAGRALTAISQIASKGVVSMEELRQQLSEALPGALAISANALNVTTAQLNALVSSGELLSSDFLPKLARELNNVASNDLPLLSRELVRFKNILDASKASAVEGIPLAQSLDILNTGLEKTQPLIDALVLSLQGALVGAFIAATTAALSFLSGFAAFGAILTGIVAGGGIVLGLAALTLLFKDLSFLIKGAGKDLDNLKKELEKPIVTKLNIDSSGIDEFSSQDIRSGNLTQDLLDDTFSFFGRDQRKGAILAINDIRESAEELIQELNDKKIDLEISTDSTALENSLNRIQDLVDERVNISERLSNREALGLSPGETKNAQLRISELTNQIETNLELDFDVKEAERALKTTRAAIQQLNQEAAKTNTSYDEQLAELARIEDSLQQNLAIVKELTRQSNGFIAAIREATALETSIGLDAEVQAADQLLERFRDLKNLAGSAAGLSLASNLQEIADLRQAIINNERVIASQKNIIANAALSDLEALSAQGINNVNTATTEQLNQVRAILDELISNGAAISERTVQIIDAELKTREINAALNQSQAQLIQANADLNETLRDLASQGLQLQQQALTLDTDTTQLKLDLVAVGDSIQNQQLLDSRRQIEDAQFDLHDLINRGIETQQQEARDLNNTLADMTQSLENGLAEIAKSQLDGATAFIEAAGLRDQLGLTELIAPIQSIIDINQGDNRESLRRESRELSLDQDQTIRDLESQRREIRNQAERSVLESRRRITDLNNQLARLPQENQISQLSLQQQALALRESALDFNREVDNFNASNQVLGRDDRFSNIALPEITVDVESLNRANAEIEENIRRLINIEGQKIQQELDFRDKSLGALGFDEQALRQGNEQRQRLIAEQIKQETERIATELANVQKTIEGTIFAVSTNLNQTGLDIRNNLNDTLKETRELLKDIDPQAFSNELVNDAGRDIARQIDQQIEDLKRQQNEYQALLDIAGEGGNGADNTLNLEENVRRSDLDQTLKNQLLAQIQLVKSNEDYAKVIDVVKQANDSLAVTEARLSQNRSEAIQKAKDLTREEQELAATRLLQDREIARIGSLDDFIEGSSADRENQFLIRKIELNRELADTIRQINEEANRNPQLDRQKAINLATEEYNNKLRTAQLEASALSEILKTSVAGAQDAIKNAILGVGQALISNTEKADAERDLRDDYAERLEKLVEDYGHNAEELAKQKELLDNQRDDIKRDIETELSTTARIFDALRSALSGFVDQIAQVAAQQAAIGIIEGAGNLLGGSGGFGGFFSSIIPNFMEGGKVGNFVMGGTIDTMSDGGEATSLGLGVLAAMEREGANAVPIVVHEGEQVLTTKNNDAQIFRAIQANGMWDEIKSNVSNFNYGGSVGSSSRAPVSGMMSKQNAAINKVINNQTNVNVYAKDYRGFNRSQDQISRQMESNQTRLANRRLS